MFIPLKRLSLLSPIRKLSLERDPTQNTKKREKQLEKQNKIHHKTKNKKKKKGRKKKKKLH